MISTATILAGTIHADTVPELKAVTDRMESFVKSGEAAGVVTLIADAGKTIHLSAVGMADTESKKPMAADSVFWIASMTKPITGTAVMMMQEAGKLSVKDPVSKYLPEFRGLKDAGGNEAIITIEQCLTHSSGLSEVSIDETAGITNLAGLMPLIVAKRLKFEPGSKWEYCQTGINTAARIVEVVSGKSFPDFLDERLFVPLGMKDTSFYPNEAMIARMASSYRKNADGKLGECHILMVQRADFPNSDGSDLRKAFHEASIRP